MLDELKAQLASAKAKWEDVRKRIAAITNPSPRQEAELVKEKQLHGEAVTELADKIAEIEATTTTPAPTK